MRNHLLRQVSIEGVGAVANPHPASVVARQVVRGPVPVSVDDSAPKRGDARPISRRRPSCVQRGPAPASWRPRDTVLTLRRKAAWGLTGLGAAVALLIYASAMWRRRAAKQ